MDRRRCAPRGNFPVDGVADLIDDFQTRYAFLTINGCAAWCVPMGRIKPKFLGLPRHGEDLGQDFERLFFEAEVLWLMQHEFAQTSEDVLWRRSKLGLRLNASRP